MISNTSHTDYVYLFRDGHEYTIKDRVLKNIYSFTSKTTFDHQALHIASKFRYVALHSNKNNQTILINLTSTSRRDITTSSPIDLVVENNRLKVVGSDHNKLVFLNY